MKCSPSRSRRLAALTPLIGVVLLAAPLAAEAQQAGR